MFIFYKSLLTFSSSLSRKFLLSNIGWESVISQVGPQPQKSVHGKFLFIVVLFTHLCRAVQKLPEKINKITW